MSNFTDFGYVHGRAIIATTNILVSIATLYLFLNYYPKETPDEKDKDIFPTYSQITSLSNKNRLEKIVFYDKIDHFITE